MKKLYRVIASVNKKLEVEVYEFEIVKETDHSYLISLGEYEKKNRRIKKTDLKKIDFTPSIHFNLLMAKAFVEEQDIEEYKELTRRKLHQHLIQLKEKVEEKLRYFEEK